MYVEAVSQHQGLSGSDRKVSQVGIDKAKIRNRFVDTDRFRMAQVARMTQRGQTGPDSVC